MQFFILTFYKSELKLKVSSASIPMAVDRGTIQKNSCGLLKTTSAVRSKDEKLVNNKVKLHLASKTFIASVSQAD